MCICMYVSAYVYVHMCMCLCVVLLFQMKLMEEGPKYKCTCAGECMEVCLPGRMKCKGRAYVQVGVLDYCAGPAWGLQLP